MAQGIRREWDICVIKDLWRIDDEHFLNGTQLIRTPVFGTLCYRIYHHNKSHTVQVANLTVLRT